MNNGALPVVSLALVLSSLLNSAACSDGESSARAAETAMSSCLSNETFDQDGASEYLGMSESSARTLADERNLRLRVVGTDLTCNDRTGDADPDRVNVYMIDDTVAWAGIG
jgi:hypothetical protein